MRVLRHLARKSGLGTSVQAAAKSEADPSTIVIAERAVQAHCESRSTKAPICTDVETASFKRLPDKHLQSPVQLLYFGCAGAL